MEKSAIKTFAVWARNELIKDLKAQAENSLQKSKDIDVVVEKIAYTWFSHFIALRFMDVNDYLHVDAEVFKEKEFSLDGVLEIFETLHRTIPEFFEKIDYKLMPSAETLKRLTESILKIPEDSWHMVQIIGWLYQEYNSERKNRIFKEKKKIEKEDIPAATQLFTPDWIVKYMVENSLGRVWSDGHRRSRLKKKWNYFIDEPRQTSTVDKSLKTIRERYPKMLPENIRCIDPCVGSGHILCYLFDVLMDIYTACGYSVRDAVRFIIERNLVGLDIDRRAAKLAVFSIFMKGLEYDKELLTGEYIPSPQIYAVGSSRWIVENGQDFLKEFISCDKELEKSVNSLLWQMRDGDEYGSIIEIRGVDFKRIYDRADRFTGNEKIKREFLLLVDTARLLSLNYDVVITNPPYMGSSGMNDRISEFVKENYCDSKYDLYGVFIERCKRMSSQGGYLAMITQNSWMFITSFEKLREKVQNIDIVNMVHLGARAFDGIEGAIVQTVAFVFRNSYIKGYRGSYIRAVEGINQQEKEKIFLSGKNRFIRTQEDFKKIPGMPVAYWISKNLIKDFEKGKNLDRFLDVKVGIQTGNNDRFIRLWHEVDTDSCSFNSRNLDEFLKSGKKWVPYNKGGQYRKWYGNYDYVVNWEDGGADIRDFKDGRGNPRSIIRNPEYHFRECITWSLISAIGISMRYRGCGSINDVSGMGAFDKGEIDPGYIMALMNTPVAKYIFSILNPTINLQVGDFKNFPVLTVDRFTESMILDIVDENISLSKEDWDMSEISWDFKISPLIRGITRLSTAYDLYRDEVNERFTQIKANEEKLSKLFIELYGLENEIDAELKDSDITVAKIFDTEFDIPEEMRGNRFVLTKSDVIKNFISYGVGCILGRYSFESEEKSSFKAEIDGLIPVTDKISFADELTTKFIEFVRAAFGSRYLDENIRFIGKNIRGRGDAYRRIRNYFSGEFYRDHCKIYQKKPIYWQINSGKKNGIKFLLYIHKYSDSTLENVELYIENVKNIYEKEILEINDEIKNVKLTRRTKLEKREADFRDKIAELEEFKLKIADLKEKNLKIDLDNGVKENYSLFEEILTKI